MGSQFKDIPTGNGDTVTIDLVRVGQERFGPLHMSELTELELADLLQDCIDETQRRKTGAAI